MAIISPDKKLEVEALAKRLYKELEAMANALSSQARRPEDLEQAYNLIDYAAYVAKIAREVNQLEPELIDYTREFDTGHVVIVKNTPAYIYQEDGKEETAFDFDVVEKLDNFIFGLYEDVTNTEPSTITVDYKDLP